MSTQDRSTFLMKKAAGGDRTAYARLVKKYGDRIRRVSYLLLHNNVAAEEILQETFARALAKIESFQGTGQPLSWFYSIALNLCRKRIRDEKRHASYAEPQKLEGGRRIRFTPRGVLTSIVRRETRMKLTIALGYLTTKQREAFVLHYVEELPYGTVGQILGVNPGAARALAHRARHELRERAPSLGL